MEFCFLSKEIFQGYKALICFIIDGDLWETHSRSQRVLSSMEVSVCPLNQYFCRPTFENNNNNNNITSHFCWSPHARLLEPSFRFILHVTQKRKLCEKVFFSSKIVVCCWHVWLLGYFVGNTREAWCFTENVYVIFLHFTFFTVISVHYGQVFLMLAQAFFEHSRIELFFWGDRIE